MFITGFGSIPVAWYATAGLAPAVRLPPDAVMRNIIATITAAKAGMRAYTALLFVR